jgi:hypothetical protein
MTGGVGLKGLTVHRAYACRFDGLPPSEQAERKYLLTFLENAPTVEAHFERSDTTNGVSR